MTQGLFWEIVGGADKGGILVRAGKELKSAEKEGRLSHGALVREIEFLENGRLHYEIVMLGDYIEMNQYFFRIVSQVEDLESDEQNW